MPAFAFFLKPNVLFFTQKSVESPSIFGLVAKKMPYG